MMKQGASGPVVKTVDGKTRVASDIIAGATTLSRIA
jgi:hypothetical protein